ncbi:transforming growth factor beta receptor type 3-like [Glandiceps talaboti]
MKTTWISTIFLLLWVLFKDSTGRSSCQVTTPFESQYVTPIYDQYRIGAGCSTSAKTDNDQEVHVINFVGRGSGIADRTPITLHIKPVNQTHTYNKPLIFVLSSQIRVKWTIQTERLAPDVHCDVIVSIGSKVKIMDGINYPVNKQTLPFDNDDLLDWVQQQYNAVTSFSACQAANNIYIKVGQNTATASQCILHNNFFSPNNLALHQEVRSATGCVSTQTGNSREIHIIEIQRLASLAQGILPIVIIEISSKTGEELRKDVLLILKANITINWKISAKGISGNLQVVTNGNVDTVGVAEGDLDIPPTIQSDLNGKSGVQFIEWIEDTYGPVLSYTEVETANRFNLQLKTTDLPQSHDTETPISTDLASTLRDQQQSLSFMDSSRLLMNVECRDSEMFVAIKRDYLELNGVTVDSLTLKNENCRATSNATHFILKTLLNDCQTSQEIQESGVRFSNTLVMTGEAPIDGSGMELEESSGEIDVLSDDEDVQTISIGFSCMYSTGPVKADSTIKPFHATRVDEFSMALYRTDLYFDRHTEYPWTLDKQSKVYVQLGQAMDDPDFGVMPHTCWLSTEQSKQREPSDVTLIENGCPGGTVQIVTNTLSGDMTETKPGSYKNFKFSFTFNADHAQYVHCEMTMCSVQRRSDFVLPLCMEQYERCIQLKVHPRNGYDFPKELLQHRYVGPIQPKEIISTKDNKHNVQESVQNKESFPVTTTAAGNNQSPIKEIIIGLETGAVVGIAFAAFVIGVLLTAALWYIHTHTGPIGHKQPQQPSEQQQPQQQQQQQAQHPLSLQGITVNGMANGTANGHVPHSYPYPSSLSTPMSAMLT